MAKYIVLLRENPGFTKLWLAQVISLTGDWFNTVVLSALVAEYSDGSGLAVSLYLLARFVPPMLISPYSGVLVDRFNRKYIMVASNVLRMLVVPLFLLANSPDMLWLIYAVTLMQFVLSSFFEPAQSAIIPALVKPDTLVEANTITSITWSVMLAAGAIVGGIFATLFGVQAALIFDAFTFAVAGMLIAWIDYKPEKGRKHRKALAAQDDTPDESEDISFAQGIRFIRRTPAMAAALFVKFGQSLGNVDTMMTIFATQIFVIGTRGELSLAIMYSLYGVGAFLGPILFNRFTDGSLRRLRRLIIVGFVGGCLGWFIMGAATSLFLVCLALFVRAIGGSINWTYSTVLIQKTAPDDKLGRMFSMDWAGFYLATVTSTFIHGALIDAAGTENIYLVALGTAVFAAIPTFIWVRAAFWLEKHEDQQSGDVPMVSVSAGSD